MYNYDFYDLQYIYTSHGLQTYDISWGEHQKLSFSHGLNRIQLFGGHLGCNGGEIKKRGLVEGEYGKTRKPEFPWFFSHEICDFRVKCPLNQLIHKFLSMGWMDYVMFNGLSG